MAGVTVLLRDEGASAPAYGQLAARLVACAIIAVPLLLAVGKRCGWFEQPEPARGPDLGLVPQRRAEVAPHPAGEGRSQRDLAEPARNRARVEAGGVAPAAEAAADALERPVEDDLAGADRGSIRIVRAAVEGVLITPYRRSR